MQAADPATEPKAAKPAPVASDAGTGGDTSDTDAGNGDDAATADAAAAERRKERLPRWVQERLARQRESVARETEDRVRREYEARQTPTERREPANVTPPSDRPPTLADFNFDHEAYTAHMVERELSRREAAQREAESRRQQNEAAEQFKSRVDDFETRVGAGAWEDIVSSPLNTDPAFKALTELFMGDEHDLDIALHLATNLTEANRINALPPLQRVREVAKLAEQFAGESVAEPAQPAKRTPPPPKQVTNAPPPAKSVSGAGKSAVDIDDPNISTEARIKAWQDAKRKR